MIGVMNMGLIAYQIYYLPFQEKLLKNIFLFIGFLASIGLTFIGIIPEDYGIFHMIPAFIFLIGETIYYFGLIYFSDHDNNSQIFIKTLFFFNVLIYWSLIYSQILPNTLNDFPPLLKIVPPYEWLLFLKIKIKKGYFSINADLRNQTSKR